MTKRYRQTVLDSLREPTTDAFRSDTAECVDELLASVSDLTGACIFVRPDESTSVLVEIDDLVLYGDPEGYVSVGKLSGDVVWGSKRWECADIDDSARLKRLGWTPVERLDDFLVGFRGTDWQFHVKTLRFRRVETNGYTLLGLGEIHATDLFTGCRHEYVFVPGQHGCLGVPDVQCKGLCPRACEGASPPVIGDCACPDTPWYLDLCVWTLVGVRCLNLYCSHDCLQTWGWGGCLCFAPFGR